MKIGFFEIKDDFYKNYLTAHLSNHELFFSDQEINASNLPDQKDFDILGIFVGSQINEAVLANFPNLKLIITLSTGFDHINLAACATRNIKVANVPTYGENTVAEHAFGLLLTLSHHLYEGYDRLRTKGQYSFAGLEGFDLLNKTIGVIGTGNIGRHSIKIANGFGMKVIAFDAFPKPQLAKELNFTYTKTLEKLLSTADIITIHVPYLPATHHLINKDNINQIKKGSILINTARGAIVETDALVKALREGILSGAGLDVLEEEGVMKDELGYLLSGDTKSDLKVVLENHELIDMDNVIVTPHSAFNTHEAKERILTQTVTNISTFITSGTPAGEVKIK